MSAEYHTWHKCIKELMKEHTTTTDGEWNAPVDLTASLQVKMQKLSWILQRWKGSFVEIFLGQISARFSLFPVSFFATRLYQNVVKLTLQADEIYNTI